MPTFLRAAINELFHHHGKTLWQLTLTWFRCFATGIWQQLYVQIINYFCSGWPCDVKCLEAFKCNCCVYNLVLYHSLIITSTTSIFGQTANRVRKVERFHPLNQHKKPSCANAYLHRSTLPPGCKRFRRVLPFAKCFIPPQLNVFH